MKIKHPFVNAKADGPNSTLVKPSDWNAFHSMDADGAAVYLGRNASGPGPVQELPIDHAASGDDFTMMTKAQVQAAIAAAMATISPGPETGDLLASLRLTKAGCLLLNGQTIGNVGSTATFPNASAQSLFNLMWAINGATWPVLPSRGATAAADWAALATIALPDARGCTIGMLDLAAGVTALIALLGVKVGASSRTLVSGDVPPHMHTAANAPFNANIGASGGGTGLFSAGINGTSISGGAEKASSSAASVLGSTLTVGGSLTGTFAPGQVVAGDGVTINIWPSAGPIVAVKILSQLTGPTGGAGTYQLDTACQTSGPGLLRAYTNDPISLVQPTMGANIFIKL